MIIFIAGTDTGIGKTVTTCSLLKRDLAVGKKVIGLKPIESGTEDRSSGHIDAALLLKAMADPNLSLDDVNLYYFRSPVAAQVAAKFEDRVIDWDTLCSFISEKESRYDTVYVEGAGGPYVPIFNNKTYVDLTLDLSMSVILVVGSKLGCINHTMATVEALRARGVKLLGYIFNELGPAEEKPRADITVSRETNRAVIKEMLKPYGVNEIGYLSYGENPALQTIAASLG